MWSKLFKREVWCRRSREYGTASIIDDENRIALGNGAHYPAPSPKIEVPERTVCWCCNKSPLTRKLRNRRPPGKRAVEKCLNLTMTATETFTLFTQWVLSWIPLWLIAYYHFSAHCPKNLHLRCALDGSRLKKSCDSLHSVSRSCTYWTFRVLVGTAVNNPAVFHTWSRIFLTLIYIIRNFTDGCFSHTPSHRSSTESLPFISAIMSTLIVP